MKAFRTVSWLSVAAACLLSAVFSAPALSIYYVNAGATGSNNGSDWNNAYTSLPASLSRGALYYLAAGSYPSHTAKDAESGTNLIIIKAATWLDHGTNTGWGASLACGTNGQQAVITQPFIFEKGYYVLDGATRNPDWRTGYGLKIHNPGTTGGNVLIGDTAPTTANNVTLQYVEIEGSYSRADINNQDKGVFSYNGGAGSANLTVQYCNIHNVGNCPFHIVGGTNILLQYNVCSTNNYGVVNNHSEGISFSFTTGFTVRYNIWEDMEGTACWTTPTSGHNAIMNTYFYGNLVYWHTNYRGNGFGDGVFFLMDCVASGDLFIYNNTFANITNTLAADIEMDSGAGGHVGSAVRWYVKNNLWYGCQAVGNPGSGPGGVQDFQWDYNAYFNTPNTDTNADKQTSSLNPFLNSAALNFQLGARTATGAVLAAPFNLDLAGDVRGADGIWDRGAFEYTAVTNTNAPVISGVQATSVSNQVATVVWTTDESATSGIQYGTDKAYGTAVTNLQLAMGHSVMLSNLTSATNYHYQVWSANSSGNQSSSGDLQFTTLTPAVTTPTVALTTPTAGQTVGGIVPLAATATDSVGVAGVQFWVDGQAVGTPVMTAPYSSTWSSYSATNGWHTIQAVATNNAGNVGASALISMQVQNATTNESAAPNYYYVFAGATGSNSGLDWNNAYTNLPAALVRGGVYYVAAGTYPSHTFNDADSGTNQIVLRSATVAIHGTNAGWQDGYAGQVIFNAPFLFQKDYYIIDGASRTGWGTGYGIKVENNPYQGGNAVNIGDTSPSSANNITLRYVEIDGSHSMGTNFDRGIQVFSGSGNVVVQYCYVHDVGNCPFLMRGVQTMFIEYCYVARNFYSPSQHSEGISASDGTANLTVRYTLFEDLEGTAIITTPSANDPTTITNWYIYGNVFYYTTNNATAGSRSRIGFGDGVFSLLDCDAYGDVYFCNNTIVNLTSSALGARGGGMTSWVGTVSGYPVNATSFYVQNNLWYQCDEAGQVLNAPGVITDFVWDSNAYYNTSVTDTNVNKQIGTGSPLVNWSGGDFHLVSATAPGAVLSAPFNMDADGDVRGADGIWDRGAYEYTAVTNTNAPVISGVQATSVSNQVATVVWTTDESATSGVQYGTDVTYGTAVTNLQLVTGHSVMLSNLTPATTYHYQVWSADSSGNQSSSGDFQFTTLTPDTTPPTVTLTTPTAGQTVEGAVPLTATATDSVGVAGVQFWVDGQAVGTPVMTAPYSSTWSSYLATNGWHTIQAVATDNAGNVGASALISVLVQNILTNGLVGYWSLNEGSGTVAIDNSGNGNTATLTNGAVWSGTNGEYSMKLNGVAAYASVSDAPVLRVSGDLTLSMLVNHTIVPTNGGYMYYIQKGLNNIDSYSLGVYGTDNGAYLFFEFTDAAGTYHWMPQVGGPALRVGVWNHVAVVFDSVSMSLTFYINGQQVSSIPNPSLLDGTITAPLSFGRQNISGYNFTMNGLVHSVRVYNRTLSQTEITTLYQAALPQPPTGLKIITP